MDRMSKSPTWQIVAEEVKRNAMRLDEAVHYLNSKRFPEHSYAEHFLSINESRGRVDGTEGIVNAVIEYVNGVIKSSIGKHHTRFDEDRKADIYEFDIPTSVFDNVDTLFMYKPVFHVQIIKYHTIRPNLRQFVDSDYLADGINPPTILVDGAKKLAYPSFRITFAANDEWYYEDWIVSSIINHEITHAKLNFEEFLEGPNANRTAQYQRKADFANASDGSVEYHVTSMWSYLCDYDEMNARASQIYDELNRLNVKYRVGFNLKRLLPMCPTYEIVTDYYQDICDTLEAHTDDKELETKMQGYLNDKNITLRSMLDKVKQCQVYQEKQFCKVAEYWLYKKVSVKV